MVEQYCFKKKPQFTDDYQIFTGHYCMNLEKRRKSAKIVSLAVIVATLLVIIGWIGDIAPLKSILNSWVTMKFDTAIAFLLSSAILYFIVRVHEGEVDRSQIALSIASLILILLMGLLFFSALFGIQTGVEELFVKEEAGIVKSVIPGRPSIPTMFNFLLIGLAAILTLLKSIQSRKYLKIIGLAVAGIGTVAVIGYILNFPVLYYYLEGKNSAMACHAAILFVLLGFGLFYAVD
jgi:hypothetical protein